MPVENDGGRRNREESALGFVPYCATMTVAGDTSYAMLATKGLLLQSMNTAFLTESLALEGALQFLIHIYQSDAV